ncbi:hypothetical protein [Rhodococcoides corynebacterioides]|uniref:Uncharacterized protein n=1 Tax=Rhodococcoides corynebacterioides TaxID=53972 RepID=A0ABS7P298_9NOCA|nr:hypothetical protein [Rhodococcus corynebacterioides]MBY6366543.1 hypothetical protein [Rhodococcus corynebacterioides]MBY6408088.1 hypothetical protein [Rhodococcus corynebacterioides]
MRDDNSIIKKLPLPVDIGAPVGHPYNKRKPWRGFTACHIWHKLPGGTLAGADPWLYSFAPNLVWLPSWLAPLTDGHESYAQALLQRTSLALFRDAPVIPSLKPWTEQAWERLPTTSTVSPLPLTQLAFFEPNDKFFTRRINALDKVLMGCESIFSSGRIPSKLICSRYTTGLPQIQTKALHKFHDAIFEYREAVVAAAP